MPERTKSSTITFSSSVKMMLARTGAKQDPIETPSICSNKILSKAWVAEQGGLGGL